MEELMERIKNVYEDELGCSLADSGSIDKKLDSIEVMRIVVALEDEFDIEFDGDELDTDTFMNLDDVCELISGKI